MCEDPAAARSYSRMCTGAPAADADPDLTLLEDDDDDIIMLPAPVLDVAGAKRPAGAAEAAAEAGLLAPASKQAKLQNGHS